MLYKILQLSLSCGFLSPPPVLSHLDLPIDNDLNTNTYMAGTGPGTFPFPKNPILYHSYLNSNSLLLECDMVPQRDRLQEQHYYEISIT